MGVVCQCSGSALRSAMVFWTITLTGCGRQQASMSRAAGVIAACHSAREAPHRSRKPKQRRDVAQPAKRIVDEATGEAPPTPAPSAGKDPAAVALGRKGGLIGGKVRAANMTKRQRTAAAKRAAAARWGQ